MEDKKNKRKIFKRIGAIVCAFAAAIVAFSLPFLGNFKPKFNSKNMVASADETISNYTFIGSDLIYLLNTIYRTGGNDNSMSWCNIQISLYGKDVAITAGSLYTGPLNNDVFKTFLLPRTTLTTTPTYYKVSDSGPAGYETWFNVIARVSSSDFNANVWKINLSSSHDSGLYKSILKYYDVNDNFAEFVFYVNETSVPGVMSSSDMEAMLFGERTYYVQNPDSFSSNQYYREGYSAGESAGYSAGETAGYSSGYSAGEIIGYNNGYSAGVEAGGNYTFFSLVSAVIDAPIQAFMGLFNFELLGINLAGFFTSLLTVAFVITVVRLVMP